MQPIVFEMETSDPDDFMTLLWLADHPQVELLAVLVTPGSRDQCQLVRWGLDLCGRPDIPIGARHGAAWWETAEGTKPRVSGFHSKVYGEDILGYPPGQVSEGPALLAGLLHRPDLTVVVGSPPKNLGKSLGQFDGKSLGCWIQQGGFAGDNLVAEPLEKFKGRLTCPSFNPGGAPKETLALLASPDIRRRLFVSKNVCHGVVWTPETQTEMKRLLADRPSRTGLRVMVEALDSYLRDKGVAKAMHDLVAAACALDPSVCHFREVEIYREKGEWGAREATGTNTWISVGIDLARFLEVLAH